MNRIILTALALGALTASAHAESCNSIDSKASRAASQINYYNDRTTDNLSAFEAASKAGDTFNAHLYLGMARDNAYSVIGAATRGLDLVDAAIAQGGCGYSKKQLQQIRADINNAINASTDMAASATRQLGN